MGRDKGLEAKRQTSKDSIEDIVRRHVSHSLLSETDGVCSNSPTGRCWAAGRGALVCSGYKDSPCLEKFKEK